MGSADMPTTPNIACESIIQQSYLSFPTSADMKYEEYDNVGGGVVPQKYEVMAPKQTRESEKHVYDFIPGDT